MYTRHNKQKQQRNTRHAYHTLRNEKKNTQQHTRHIICMQHLVQQDDGTQTLHTPSIHTNKRRLADKNRHTHTYTHSHTLCTRKSNKQLRSRTCAKYTALFHIISAEKHMHTNTTHTYTQHLAISQKQKAHGSASRARTMFI